jgi:hypothetical protein
MSLGNILGLYLLAPVVRRELRGYRGKLASGEIRAKRFDRGAAEPDRISSAP